jgi:hypothetical protein
MDGLTLCVGDHFVLDRGESGPVEVVVVAVKDAEPNALPRLTLAFPWQVSR